MTERNTVDRTAGDRVGRLSFSVATRQAFFERIAERLGLTLPPDYRRFERIAYFHIMKVSYANERVHYEVGIDVQRALLEIALHFEDGPASTLKHLALFDRHIVELKHRLGAEVELERWTLSWGRLYETRTLSSLDRGVADSTAARLSEFIAAIQPILDAAALPAEDARSPRKPFKPDRRQRMSSVTR